MATWPGTIATASSGGVGAATDFNTHATALSVVGGAWTAYTPTWTGSTTDPTLGASSVSGRYRLAGKTADVRLSISVGAGFSAGSGVYRFGLPSGVVSLNTGTNDCLGVATVVDISTQSYTAAAYHVSTGIFSILVGNAPIGAASPFAWATGDRISVLISSLEIT